MKQKMYILCAVDAGFSGPYVQGCHAVFEMGRKYPDWDHGAFVMLKSTVVEITRLNEELQGDKLLYKERGIPTAFCIISDKVIFPNHKLLGYK